MNKYALVGRDISHSRSPEMYRKLISPSVEYDLLDYKNPADIPSAKTLLNLYDGINITSPYKKHFLGEIELTDTAREIGAVNCLKKESGIILGENTDYLAIVDILNDLMKVHGMLEIKILGDGVMSKVVQVALKSLNQDYELFSRRITHNFNQLNLNNFITNQKALVLVINTCSREYIFSGELPENSIFWDFNYNFPQHSQHFSSKKLKYYDGIEMLERQAFYAIAFWSNRHTV